MYRLSSRLVIAFGIISLFAACATPTTSSVAEKKIDPVGVVARNAEIVPPTTGNLAQFPATENVVKSKSVESDTEKAVRARAQIRWDYLIKGDIDSAYRFLSPNSRLAQPLDTYKSRIRLGFWQSAEVIRVDCAEISRCNVQSKVRVKMAGTRGGLIDHESVVSEDWLGLSGEWWFVPPPR